MNRWDKVRVQGIRVRLCIVILCAHAWNVSKMTSTRIWLPIPVVGVAGQADIQVVEGDDNNNIENSNDEIEIHRGHEKNIDGNFINLDKDDIHNIMKDNEDQHEPSQQESSYKSKHVAVHSFDDPRLEITKKVTSGEEAFLRHIQRKIEMKMKTDTRHNDRNYSDDDYHNHMDSPSPSPSPSSPTLNQNRSRPLLKASLFRPKSKSRHAYASQQYDKEKSEEEAKKTKTSKNHDPSTSTRTHMDNNNDNNNDNDNDNDNNNDEHINSSIHSHQVLQQQLYPLSAPYGLYPNTIIDRLTYVRLYNQALDGSIDSMYVLGLIHLYGLYNSDTTSTRVDSHNGGGKSKRGGGGGTGGGGGDGDGDGNAAFVDPIKGVEWLKKAAEHTRSDNDAISATATGHMDALCALGIVYYYGLEDAKDSSSSSSSSSSNTSKNTRMNTSATTSASTNSVKMDKKEAMRWFLRAAVFTSTAAANDATKNHRNVNEHENKNRHHRYRHQRSYWMLGRMLYEGMTWEDIGVDFYTETLETMGVPSTSTSTSSGKQSHDSFTFLPSPTMNIPPSSSPSPSPSSSSSSSSSPSPAPILHLIGLKQQQPNESNYIQAARLFAKAPNIPEAIHNLAILYEYNLIPSSHNFLYEEEKEDNTNKGRYSSPKHTVNYHYTMAATLYSRAGEVMGHVDSLYHLGLMYAHGRGVPLNYAKAIDLFRRAIMATSSPSSTDMKNMQVGDYTRTRGPHAPSMRFLGLMAMRGYGQPNDTPNPREAIRWFGLCVKYGKDTGGRNDNSSASSSPPMGGMVNDDEQDDDNHGGDHTHTLTQHMNIGDLCSKELMELRDIIDATESYLSRVLQNITNTQKMMSNIQQDEGIENSYMERPIKNGYHARDENNDNDNDDDEAQSKRKGGEMKNKNYYTRFFPVR